MTVQITEQDLKRLMKEIGEARRRGADTLIAEALSNFEPSASPSYVRFVIRLEAG